MPTFVSLLRGINVGGNNKVPMNELKELCTSLGFRDVATYIQSGNVVCCTDAKDMAQVTRQIEDAFAQKFGFRVNIIVRTKDELDAIIANNPFENQPKKESKWVLVLFLANRPEKASLEDLRKVYSGPEEYYLIGQELYIYYPEGMGRSKFTLPLIEKKLKTSGTGRNWNTVLQLQKMMQG